MSLKVGDKAPSFKLFNSDKRQVALEDFAGKNLVVLFFPLAFTGVCTKELCGMRDDITSYQNLAAEVVAISVDSLFTLERFKKDQNLNFPLLSDFNKTTAAAYGALYENFVLGMKGVAKRSAFVVDGEGIIRYVEVLDNAGEIPNFKAVKETLASLN